jgi:hypothetical protein
MNILLFFWYGEFLECSLCHIHAFNFSMNRSWEHEIVSRGQSLMRETLTNAGKLGLRLLEDLTALAAGGSVCTI